MRAVSFAAKAGLLSALLSLASCVATSPSREAQSSVSVALDEKAPALLVKHKVASIGLALIVDGRVVLERGYGEQSPESLAHPPRSTTWRR